jgi:hypothetical protein
MKKSIDSVALELACRKISRQRDRDNDNVVCPVATSICPECNITKGKICELLMFHYRKQAKAKRKGL